MSRSSAKVSPARITGLRIAQMAGPSEGVAERTVIADVSSRLFGGRAPGAAFALPGDLPVDPQVDKDALEAPLAIAFLGQRVPGAEAEHAVLEGLHVVLQDRPETLDPHSCLALGAHQNLAHAMLASEVVVGLAVPQRVGRALEPVAPLATALRP